MGVVVDTSALVAAERRREDDISGTQLTLCSLLGRLASESAVLPAAVYAELLVGVHLAGSPAQAAAPRAHIDDHIAREPIIDFNAAIAHCRCQARITHSKEVPFSMPIDITDSAQNETRGGLVAAYPHRASGKSAANPASHGIRGDRPTRRLAHGLEVGTQALHPGPTPQ